MDESTTPLIQMVTFNEKLNPYVETLGEIFLFFFMCSRVKIFWRRFDFFWRIWKNVLYGESF